MAVNKISKISRDKIISKSVQPLPNNPGRAGMKADAVKKAMFAFVTDEKESVVEEINRVVEEINDYKFKPSIYHLILEEDVNIVVKKSINKNDVSSIVENAKLKVFVDEKLYKEYDLSVQEEVQKLNFIEFVFITSIKSQTGNGLEK